MAFDFGAGTLGGHIVAINNDGNRGGYDLGRYDFVNIVFGVGSTGFSGSLTHSGATDLGAFDGLLTGPNAEEVMARWTAPYFNQGTQSWSTMFGV